MARIPRDELVRRLRAATTRPLPDDVRERHLAAILAAASIAEPDAAVAAGSARGRGRIAAMVATVALAAPSGIAVAAQGAHPGDTLYEVKRFTERLATVVDDDLAARRRIEELRRLLAEGADTATLEQATAAAVAEVETLPADHPRVGELTILLAQVERATAPPPVDNLPDRAADEDDDDVDDDPDEGHGEDDEGREEDEGEDDDEDQDEDDEGEGDEGDEGEDDEDHGEDDD